MDKDPLDPNEWSAPLRNEDQRLWWQKLADGIAEALSGAIRLSFWSWTAWDWRSRHWWRNRDDF